MAKYIHFLKSLQLTVTTKETLRKEQVVSEIDKEGIKTCLRHIQFYSPNRHPTRDVK